MTALLGCCGMDLGWWRLCLSPFPEGLHLLEAPWHSPLPRVTYVCTGVILVTAPRLTLHLGWFGCLSEMAFAVHHLTIWRSAECALLHGQWHRVTFLLWGRVAASNGHCANLVVETPRKPDKRLQNYFFGGI